MTYPTHLPSGSPARLHHAGRIAQTPRRRAAILGLAVAFAVPSIGLLAGHSYGAAVPAVVQDDPAQAEEARRHYVAGIAAYQAGDFATARTELTRAQELGYTPGLFEDEPAVVLRRISDREAAMEAQQNQQDQPATQMEDQQRQQALAQQQARTRAADLFRQGAEAELAGNRQGAIDAYSQALQLDPTLTEAQERLTTLQSQTAPGQTTQDDPLGRFGQDRQVRRQLITFNFNEATAEAREAAGQNQFNDARAALQRAQAARNTNPGVFSNEELADFDRQIAELRTLINQQETTWQARVEAQEGQAAARSAAEREQAERAQRREVIAGLRRDAMQAVEDRNYEAALDIVDQILSIDPDNEYAVGARPLIEDRVFLGRQQRYHDRYNRERTSSFTEAQEKRIPYSDIMRYPDDWPDLTERRDRTVQEERGAEQEDAQLLALLDKPIGVPLDFDRVPFEDVISFLQNVTQASIFVNYSALELEGVERSAEVTLELQPTVPLRKALELILNQVSGGFAELGFDVDAGVLTISTQEELSRNVEVQIVDIRDLIVVPPDFIGQIQQGGGQGGGGGGGFGGGGGGGFGGGGGGGIGGGSGGGGGGLGGAGGGGGIGGGGGGGGGGIGGGGGGQGGIGGEGPTREELIEDIIELITETVATDSWEDNGGDVGAINEYNGQLVVRQTGENMREVLRLLSKLRETRAIQVNVEARFLTVQRNFLEDIGVDFDFIFNFDDPPGPGETGFGPIAVNQNSANFTGGAGLLTGVPGNLVEGANPPALQTQFTAFLDNFRASVLLRATQLRSDVQSLTAPNLTLFNGQRAFVQVTTDNFYVANLTPVVAAGAIGFQPTVGIAPTGVVLNVHATVSADRRYVTLTVQPQLFRLNGLSVFPISSVVTPGAGGGVGGGGGDDDQLLVEGAIQLPEIEVTQIATTVSVPDGGTLLLGGQTLSGEIIRESGVPVLSKIPFLKRLFNNRAFAKDEQVLLILIKPRIIIQREIEQENFPLLAPPS